MAYIASAAQGFLNDPLREYVTSDYVKVELFPKCLYHKNNLELAFYQSFFNSTPIVVSNDDSLLALAINEGARTGISGIDAIHVACALVAGATELITSERSTKPIHRANGIKVISINP